MRKATRQAFDPHHLRRAQRIEHVHIDRKAGLQVGELEEALHQHLGLDGAGAGLEHQADILGRLVADIAQQGRLLGFDQAGELLDQIGLLHLIGDLGDHDPPQPAAGVLPGPARAQPHAAAAGLIGLQHGRARLDDDPAGGKVGTLDMLHQLGGRRLGAIQDHQAGVDQLGGVVRRDGGRHAHGDARGAIGQQIGKAGRQHHRLMLLAIVGRAKIDRVLVDPVQQQLSGLGEAALCVAHGRGVIAVDVAEVPLAIDQAVALGEVLGQAHQGVVDGDVAVRVVFADHIAHHPRRFLGRGLGIQPQQAHGVEQAAMDRLQTIAHIRQRPLGDGRERIGQIPPRQRLGQGLVDDAAAILGRLGRRRDAFVHEPV